MLTIIRKQKITVEDMTIALTYLLDKSSQDDSVRTLAINITANSSDKIAAVYDWVKENIAYVEDPIDNNGITSELFISPIRMVKDYNEGKTLAGDCDDHALMCTALYRSIGLKSNIVLLARHDIEYDHAVCEVESNLGMLTIDTTGNTPPGWQETYTKKLVI